MYLFLHGFGSTDAVLLPVAVASLFSHMCFTKNGNKSCTPEAWMDRPEIRWIDLAGRSIPPRLLHMFSIALIILTGTQSLGATILLLKECGYCWLRCCLLHATTGDGAFGLKNVLEVLPVLGPRPHISQITESMDSDDDSQ